MKESHGHERLVEQYIERNFAQIHLPRIPLGVPSWDDKLLLNCRTDESDGRREILVSTEEPGRRFTVARRDGEPMQVVEMDPRRENFGHELFHEPIKQLALTSLNACVWHVDIDEDNISHSATFSSFIGHLSIFARGKQGKLMMQLPPKEQ